MIEYELIDELNTIVFYVSVSLIFQTKKGF